MQMRFLQLVAELGVVRGRSGFFGSVERCPEADLHADRVKLPDVA